MLGKILGLFVVDMALVEAGVKKDVSRKGERGGNPEASVLVSKVLSCGRLLRRVGKKKSQYNIDVVINVVITQDSPFYECRWNLNG
jgi:hypothetical protein